MILEGELMEEEKKKKEERGNSENDLLVIVISEAPFLNLGIHQKVKEGEKKEEKKRNKMIRV